MNNVRDSADLFILFNFLISLPALNLMQSYTPLCYYTNMVIMCIKIVISIMSISFLCLAGKHSKDKFLNENYIHVYKNTNKEQIGIMVYFSIIAVYINSPLILIWIALCILEKLLMHKEIKINER